MWDGLQHGSPRRGGGHEGCRGHFSLLPDIPVCVPIPPQIGLFISYDNATKQLDTVYDITPALAQAFLERIGSSSFDVRNTSTMYRQGRRGAPACFPRRALGPRAWRGACPLRDPSCGVPRGAGAGTDAPGTLLPPGHVPRWQRGAGRWSVLNTQLHSVHSKADASFP